MLWCKLSETLGAPERWASGKCYSPKAGRASLWINLFTAFDSELLYNLDHVWWLNHPFAEVPTSSAASPYRSAGCRLQVPGSELEWSPTDLYRQLCLLAGVWGTYAGNAKPAYLEVPATVPTVVAASSMCASARSAVPKGHWRQDGQRDCCCCHFMGRKLNRLVCVWRGFMTFELPVPEMEGGDIWLTCCSIMDRKVTVFMEAQ